MIFVHPNFFRLGATDTQLAEHTYRNLCPVTRVAQTSSNFKPSKQHQFINGKTHLLEVIFGRSEVHFLRSLIEIDLDKIH